MKKSRQLLKFIYLLQIFIVLCSTVLSPLTVQAAAENKTDYGSQFITHVELEDGDDNPKTNFSIYDEMKAAWNFTIPAGEAKAGDTMTVSIPSVFTLAKATSFDITDPAGIVIGHAVADPNTYKLTVTLTDAVQENHDAITGQFKLWVKWNQSEVQQNTTVPINWGVDGSTQNVNIDPSVPDSSTVIEKWGWYDATDPTKIDWQVRVNYAKEQINNANYTDNIGDNQELVSGSVKAETVTYNADSSYTVDSTYPSTAIGTKEDGEPFTVNLGDINKTVVISYSTRITDNGVSSKYENSGELTGDNIESKPVDVYSPNNGGGGNADTSVDIKGQKTWQDDNDQDGLRPDKITVHLLVNGKTVQNKTVTAQDGWAYDFTNLKKYDDNGKPIQYTIAEDTVPGYTSKTNGYNLINTHEPETTQVSGQKTWRDNNNQDGLRPDKITVNLLANGKTVQSKTVTAQDDWAYSFTNLPKYESGKLITYTVSEDTVPGYTSKTNGYDLINTHDPEIIQVSGHKKWEDDNNQDGLRPDKIIVNLLANGKAIQSKTVTAQDDWAYNFSNLPKYDSDGKLIVYAISEDTVPGYTSKTDGYDLINTVNPTPVNPTPVNPTPVNPTPVNPTPVNPTPVNPTPVTPSPKKPEKQHDRLPQTGESQNETLLVIGGMLVLMGFIMLGVELNKKFKKDK